MISSFNFECVHRAEQLPWLLNLTQIIQVTPGSGHQGLHRDDGVFAFEHSVLGNLEYELSTIWYAATLITCACAYSRAQNITKLLLPCCRALHDFTAELGATRVVPGEFLAIVIIPHCVRSGCSQSRRLKRPNMAVARHREPPLAGVSQARRHGELPSSDATGGQEGREGPSNERAILIWGQRF